MPRYLVKGADRNTGRELEFEADARNAQAAEEQARHNMMVVSSVTELHPMSEAHRLAAAEARIRVLTDQLRERDAGRFPVTDEEIDAADAAPGRLASAGEIAREARRRMFFMPAKEKADLTVALPRDFFHKLFWTISFAIAIGVPIAAFVALFVLGFLFGVAFGGWPTP